MKRIKDLLAGMMMALLLPYGLYADVDYAITDFQIPSQITIGTTGIVKVTVKNVGDTAPVTEEFWEVNLCDENNNSLAMHRPARGSSEARLQPGAEVNIEFSITPNLNFNAKQKYYVKIEGDDVNKENNTSETKEINILRPTYPKVTNLKAEQIGEDIALSWVAPVFGDSIAFFRYNIYLNGVSITDNSNPDLKDITKAAYTYVGTEPIIYKFKVTVFYDKGGETVESDFSNEVTVDCSSDRIIYYQSFDTEEDFNTMTIINANDDARTWQYNESTQIAFYQFNMANGADDWLITPTIQLKANSLYTLSFKTGNRNRDAERIKVAMGTAPTVEGMTTELVSPMELTDGEWHTIKVTVSVPADGDYHIGFQACSDAGKFQLQLDQIKVEQNIGYDMFLESVEAPLEVKAGNDAEININVKNMGSLTASGYTVELYSGETVLESKAGSEVNPGKTSKVAFTIKTKLEDSGILNYHAIIKWSADLDNSNNNSDEIAIKIITPKYPTVTDLNGSEDEGTVNLSWTAPDYSAGSPISKSMTDGFEDYTAFAITNIGNWTMVDGDEGETGAAGEGTYDNATAPKAYMVFNPASAGVADDEMWKPYSGEQMLVCFDGPATNDDWLISPEIVTGGQVISFYAKTADAKVGNETFEVLTSTTDNATTSFTKLEEVTSVPGEWTSYTFTIPDNAKYFAIHCISSDVSALLIDDLYYSYKDGMESLTLKGYNVYRDGTKITETPVNATTYADNTVGKNTHTYKVTTVYDKGESLYSNEISINVIGNAIESTSAENIIITGSEGRIKISGITNEPIQIYTVDGKLVYSSSKSDSSVTVSVSTGSYIVKAGTKVAKVLVK
ncbi:MULTISPECIES: choice-of-anchor J domain-containing protein [unclassified Bacteroides]|jgi:hypothetical protein|uniref:choice-of-anchor J domain-containing protein n=1 Tax=unclassified Bacteroides TaxID=2646097 RepID=UPI000E85689E|nr:MULTISPECIES: choice-of-anchor J domain-containing protein [unclassified Bacteroides]RGN49131.1 hypothetical protein DXB63_06220 [Bacteroides sp. OM05-12]RHR83241.1 hypothetical protein DWW69_00105 [Bacteroides sp. AF16-49]